MNTHRRDSLRRGRRASRRGLRLVSDARAELVAKAHGIRIRDAPGEGERGHAATLVHFGCAREGLGITMMPRSVSERASQNGKLGIHPLPRREALVPTMFIRRKSVVSAALSRFVECALACASAAAARTHPERKAKRQAKLSKIA